MIQRLTGGATRPMVSVLTATIPERWQLLNDNVRSVRTQTFPDWEHLILEDTDKTSSAMTTNTLAEAAMADWLFILNDDDVMLPRCLSAHLAASADADIVYSPPLVEGEDPHQFWGSPPNIPCTALIRTELWRSIGGYNERLLATEDRDFYTRAIERRHARFARVDQHLWIYRFHGANKSRA